MGREGDGDRGWGRGCTRTGGGDHVLDEHALEQRERGFERALGPPEREREAELGHLLEQQAAHALLNLLEALALLRQHRADPVRPEANRAKYVVVVRVRVRVRVRE